RGRGLVFGATADGGRYRRPRQQEIDNYSHFSAVRSDLENDLQPELHLPWVERRRDFAEVLRIVGGRRRIVEVRMVERVEQLRAELNLEPLGKLEIPAQGEVKVLEARSDDDVATRGSERSDRLRLKRGFVEPLFDSLRPGVRIADQVRTVVAVKSVAD